MLIGMLIPGVIALVIIAGLVTIGDRVRIVFDINLINFFEVF